MTRFALSAVLLVCAGTACAQDQSAIFTAAGFTLAGSDWRKCDDPGTAGYLPGRIDSMADVNGDGLPDAVVMEDSTYCFGNTGTGFALVSQQADGSWQMIAENAGFPRFLTSNGASGWPDMEVGGPGFCFPVFRWDGSAYVPHGFEYEGKPCQP